MRYFGYLAAAILLLFTRLSFAEQHYQLEKVVELTRHGVRPPTAGTRKDIESVTHRAWPVWSTADGELTGHGYSAVVNKGRWEGDHYRQLGLLRPGCAGNQQVYVRTSPLQRTRATGQALMDGAFPGCGVAIHHVTGDIDPLFQSEKLPATHIDPARAYADIARRAGDLNALRTRLAPAIQQLKQAVCATGSDCPFFDQPWQLKQTKGGATYVQGLSVMASMVETLRLAWSENLPLDDIAWGNLKTAANITALLPLLAANTELSTDIPYLAQRRGSILLQALLQSISPSSDADSNAVRWLVLVAHDTNISMVRTLMGFHWQLPGYGSDNIPPGGSLVFERWRDTQSGERFLRIYFQAQSLEDLRALRPVDNAHPLLRETWKNSHCKQTDVGTLCPLTTTLATFARQIDQHAVVPEPLFLTSH